MVCGTVNQFFGYGVSFLTMIYWYSQRKQHFFVIAFLFVLIAADANASVMNFQANLRIPILFFLMFFSLEALYRGLFGIKKIFFYTLPFFIIAFSVILLSPTPIMSLAKTVSYFFLIFISLHYFPYLILKSRGKIVIDIAYFVTLVGTLSIILYIVAPRFVIWRPGTSAETFSGFFANPNGVGLYATLVVPFVFILSHIFHNKRQLLYFSTVIFFISAILSESRTALASLLLFFGLYFFHVYLVKSDRRWKRRIKNWGKKLLWFFLAPLGLIIIGSFGVTGLIEAFGLGEALDVHTIETGAGRFIAWEHALEEIARNPWLGKGFHYDVHYFREISEILYRLGHEGGSHNSYLAFMLNVGLFGLFCYLFFLINLIRQIKGFAKNFIVPYLILILMSTNFEAWLASSVNYVTIFFYLTLIHLIYFERIKSEAKLYDRQFLGASK